MVRHRDDPRRQSGQTFLTLLFGDPFGGPFFWENSMNDEFPISVTHFHPMTPKGMDSVVFFCSKQEAEIRLAKIDVTACRDWHRNDIMEISVQETRFGWVIECANQHWEDHERLKYFGVKK